MHFLYVFILPFTYNSTCFERPSRSSSGVHDLLYSAALYGSNRKTEQLDTFQHGLYRAAEYSKSWTPDDERNGRSKHVELYINGRINTYRKCILLVRLYNWLRCAVRTTSNLKVQYGSLKSDVTSVSPEVRQASRLERQQERWRPCVFVIKENLSLFHLMIRGNKAES